MEKESTTCESNALVKSSLEFEAVIENALKAILTELGVTNYPDNFSYTNLLVSKEKGYDLTLNVFAFAKELKKKPDELAQAVFEKLEATKPACFAGHLRTGAYIQLKLSPYPLAVAAIGEFVLPHAPPVGKNVIIEFSSPNSNKPQHLGHVRNNCLGTACSNLLTSQGNKVTKIALLNNRGVHICKSMVAYKHFGEGSTPESVGMKSDHFVGKYYVLFETVFQREFALWLETEQAQEEFGKWQASSGGKTAVAKAQKEHQKVVEKAKKAGNPIPEFDAFKIFKSEYKNYYMNNFSAIGKEALEMLVLWEANDQPTRELWTTMNGWVFDGFNTTYANYGVTFDQWERESEIYLLGKDSILKALDEGRLERFENGAVGCDLVEIGVLKPNTGEERKKALLRANGTAIYMTQDVGTALNRLAKYDATRMIYVVANEQDRHFEILFKLIEHMRPDLKGGFYHLSYGMVNLPSGKMKSREGTVVDADDLLMGLSEMAYEITKSKWPELSETDLKFRADKIALAAIKFFILSFGPATTVLFDPAASLQFSGKAGPYLLYQYARTRSIFDKAQINPNELKWDQECLKTLGTAEEIDVLRKLYLFPKEVKLAAQTLDPSKVTDATYELTRSFNQFYKQKDKHQVVNCTDPVLKQARLLLCLAFSTCVRTGLELLGIECLERM